MNNYFHIFQSIPDKTPIRVQSKLCIRTISNLCVSRKTNVSESSIICVLLFVLMGYFISYDKRNQRTVSVRLSIDSQRTTTLNYKE